MSEFDKPEIEVDIYGDTAKPKPGDFRYMYVLFTLEHRAYSASEALELAEKMKADGHDDVHIIKADLGKMDAVGFEWPVPVIT